MRGTRVARRWLLQDGGRGAPRADNLPHGGRRLRGSDDRFPSNRQGTNDGVEVRRFRRGEESRVGEGRAQVAQARPRTGLGSGDRRGLEGVVVEGELQQNRVSSDCCSWHGARHHDLAKGSHSLSDIGGGDLVQGLVGYGRNTRGAACQHGPGRPTREGVCRASWEANWAASPTSCRKSVAQECCWWLEVCCNTCRLGDGRAIAVYVLSVLSFSLSLCPRKFPCLEIRPAFTHMLTGCGAGSRGLALHFNLCHRKLQQQGSSTNMHKRHAPHYHSFCACDSRRCARVQHRQQM